MPSPLFSSIEPIRTGRKHSSARYIRASRSRSIVDHSHPPNIFSQTHPTSHLSIPPPIAQLLTFRLLDNKREIIGWYTLFQRGCHTVPTSLSSFYSPFQLSSWCTSSPLPYPTSLLYHQYFPSPLPLSSSPLPRPTSKTDTGRILCTFSSPFVRAINFLNIPSGGTEPVARTTFGAFGWCSPDFCLPSAVGYE